MKKIFLRQKVNSSVTVSLIRTKPNASTQTIQALTMWSRNKTLEWLNENSLIFPIQRTTYILNKAIVFLNNRPIV